MRNSSAAAGPTCGTRLDLPDVLERFQREARRDVFDTGRYRCSFYVWGHGPPLVFIPGLCDDALSFVLPIARLSELFRCIAYDLPEGHGDGARLGRYRHCDLVQDHLALVEYLGLGQTALFGSSFGSTIALAALHTRPDLFSTAILQGGFARRPLRRAEIPLACFGRYWPWDMSALPWRAQVLEHSHRSPFLDRGPEFWQYFLERCGDPPMAAVAYRAMLLHRVDLRPILGEIRQPVLLVVGDRDPLVGKQCEQELLRGLPRVLRAEIENCGHLPQFSHPEVLAELVQRYLSETLTD
ncbi:MAG: alpha/beta hydrolase [Gemmataceae bacterium]|nr:alpha/beta hydrolase [Gemmataceae bacterium]MCI0738251.1 alpha/beta hydrolase [Gemmataceae bacterium]